MWVEGEMRTMDNKKARKIQIAAMKPQLVSSGPYCVTVPEGDLAQLTLLQVIPTLKRGRGMGRPYPISGA